MTEWGRDFEFWRDGGPATQPAAFALLAGISRKQMPGLRPCVPCVPCVGPGSGSEDGLPIYSKGSNVSPEIPMTAVPVHRMLRNKNGDGIVSPYVSDEEARVQHGMGFGNWWWRREKGQMVRITPVRRGGLEDAALHTIV